MKKIISLILVLALLLSITACVKTNNEEQIQNEQEIEEVINNEETQEAEKQPEKEPAKQPEKQPEKEPVKEPAKEPEKQPEAPKTVGNILLADFYNKVSLGSALSIAESLISNEIIKFMGGAMSVEEGYLAGFKEEIKGFKEAATFAPMIGTIPFVGYIFTLEDGADVNAFVSNLKSLADLRWNICTEADEMVTGISGNTVFFVMCPTEFEEE